MTSSDAQTIIDQWEDRHPELGHLRPRLSEAVTILCECHRNGGKILLCGNGGSAADCAHITGELVKGFRRKRPMPQQRERLNSAPNLPEDEVLDLLQGGLCVINLCSATALITAIANDQSPDLIFAQPVFAMGRPGDVLIGLTTSGDSMNVVRAMQVACARDMQVIGFRGDKTGKIDTFCDVIINVPARETSAVQEYHSPVYHALCALVEANLFPTRSS